MFNESPHTTTWYSELFEIWFQNNVKLVLCGQIDSSRGLDKVGGAAGGNAVGVTVEKTKGVGVALGGELGVDCAGGIYKMSIEEFIP